jgi:hypothetical protein
VGDGPCRGCAGERQSHHRMDDTPEVGSSLFMEYDMDGRDYTHQFASCFLMLVAGRLLESFPLTMHFSTCGLVGPLPIRPTSRCWCPAAVTRIKFVRLALGKKRRVLIRTSRSCKRATAGFPHFVTFRSWTRSFPPT